MGGETARSGYLEAYQISVFSLRVRRLFVTHFKCTTPYDWI